MTINNPERRGINPQETPGNAGPQVDYAPSPSSTGIWVVLFATTMMFAAFTSALFVRKGSSSSLDWGWQAFTVPSILYFNTLLLFASSATLEVSRRRVATFMGGMKGESNSPSRWLYVTLFLGLLFVAGQCVAWLQLRNRGLYLATSASSSFFYVLTVTHALHVVGGLVGLLYVIHKLGYWSLRRDQMDAAARYWHFMGGIWLYLLLLLRMKL